MNEIKFLVDAHVHTVLSGHAHSTVLECIEFASKAGLEAIVIADHSGVIQGGPKLNIGFDTYLQFPREYAGVHIFRGAETNIVDYTGKIDLFEPHLSNMDFLIASFHEIALRPGDKAQNTTALLGALNNPWIDLIGHPGNPKYPIDCEAIVREAARLGKLLEVNNHSFSGNARRGSPEVCAQIISLCKRHGVRICVSSDAHICFRVGGFDLAMQALQAQGFPDELVVTRNLPAFNVYLGERRRRLNMMSS